MVCRTVAKMYQSNLKANAFSQLSDVGFFYNKFMDVTLRTDVLPWLFEETDKYLEELNASNQIPTEIVNGFIEGWSNEHELTIKAHNEKRDKAAQEAREQEEAKIAAKAQRKREREAARKAE